MDHDKQTPPAGQDTDLTKAQSPQQPQAEPFPAEAPTGQADYGSAGKIAGQSDSATQQRIDIEGGTATGQATTANGDTQFVGSQAATDTSSDLIEDDESTDFAKNGQGAPE